MSNLSEKINKYGITATEIAVSLLSDNKGEIENDMADQNKENRYSTQQRNQVSYSRKSNGTTAPTDATSPGKYKKKFVDYKSEEYKAERAKLREELNSIDITEVLDKLGAESHQDGDPSKWKIHGVGNIIHKGNGWLNVNTNVKGYGGINLIKMALNLEYEHQAISWMIEQFGESISDDIKVSNEGYKENVFTPPEENPRNINNVRRYLSEKRGVPIELVDDLINSRKLYADDNNNCVFLSKASAEVRSVFGSFKGCCEGSNVNNSGFYVMLKPKASEKTIALVEAAVDALSYNALFPGRLSYSTNGSGRFFLQYDILIESLERNTKVKAAFDADWAGDEAAQRLFNALFIRKLLPHKFKNHENPITAENIDEWIKEGSITFEIENSPHYNFFNEGWQPEKKQLDMEIIKDEEGKLKKIAVDNGKIAAPTVTIKISQDIHPELKRGTMNFIVGTGAYEGIINKMGFARERPLNKKDWNEELLLLGSKYLLEYSQSHKKDFTIVPKLPDYLEYYRNGDASLNPYLKPNGQVVKEEVNKKLKM